MLFISSCTVVEVPSQSIVKYYPGFVYIKSEKEFAYDMKSFGLQTSNKGFHLGFIKEQAVINPKNNQTFIFPIKNNE